MPRETRATFALGTALVGVLLSACAASGQGAQAVHAPVASSVPGAAPWVDRSGSIFVGSPLPVAPLPTEGPPCRASDLKVSFTGSSGAMGEMFFWYDFTNIGSTSCILRGFPRVVATRQGEALLVAADSATFFGFPLQPETMAPGASTKLILGTNRDCPLAGESGSPRTPTDPTITVSIPGGDTIVLPGHVRPLCGLFADQFGLQLPESAYTMSPIDGATTALEMPRAVKAGSTLRYVVDLTNPTSSDMVLDPCPSYHQWVGVASKAAVELNCDAVPVLSAHTTRRFAMQLAVPADVPAGSATVYWTVAAAAVDIGARAAIQVVAP